MVEAEKPIDTGAKVEEKKAAPKKEEDKTIEELEEDEL